MIEDVCAFIAKIEADPRANLFPDGITIGEYYKVIRECREHVIKCDRCKDALNRIPETDHDGPTTTLN